MKCIREDSCPMFADGHCAQCVVKRTAIKNKLKNKKPEEQTTLEIENEIQKKTNNS